MASPNRGIGRFRVFFCDPETTFGSPATDYPVAADGLRLISGSVNVSTPRGPREDANGTAGDDGSINEKGTVEWSAEFYLLASGTAATAPDWDDLLTYCVGMTKAEASDTTISGTSSTTTQADVVDASGFAVGDAVTIAGETRIVTAVDTASTPDNITVEPPFSTAPTTNGTTVTAGIVWSFNSDSDHTPSSATLWMGNNSHLYRLVGAYATSMRIGLGGAGAARLSVTGTAKSASVLMSSTLNGSINNSTTTVSVAQADAELVPDDVSTSIPYYYTMDPGGANEEHIRVTAKSGADLTVVRGELGSSGTAQNSGARIAPYQPTATTTGTPVPATGGHCYANDILTPVESASWECDMGRQPVENEHGSSWVVANYSNGKRKPVLTVEGFSYIETMTSLVRHALARSSFPLFVQQGTATGAIVGAYSGTFYPENPGTSLDDQDVRWTLTGPAQMSTATANDEVRIVHG
jgi:hypothetical protein